MDDKNKREEELKRQLMKGEQLRQQIAVLNWVLDGFPPIDLNTVSLGVKDIVELSSRQQVAIDRCFKMIRDTKILMTKENAQFAEELIQGLEIFIKHEN